MTRAAILFVIVTARELTPITVLNNPSKGSGDIGGSKIHQPDESELLAADERKGESKAEEDGNRTHQ